MGESRKNVKNILWGFAIIAIAVVLDQISKWYIVQNFEPFQKNILTVIPGFFYISHIRNAGAAWGILSGNTFMLVGFTGLVLLAAAVFLCFTNRLTLTIPIAMIIGGGFGNLIDRIFRNGVVDFLDVYIFGYDFPVFNLADSILVCGTILLGGYVLFLYKDENPGFRIRRKPV